MKKSQWYTRHRSVFSFLPGSLCSLYLSLHACVAVDPSVDIEIGSAHRFTRPNISLRSCFGDNKWESRERVIRFKRSIAHTPPMHVPNRSPTHPVVVVEADRLEAECVLEHFEHVGRDERGQLRAQVDVLDAEVEHGEEDGDGCGVVVGGGGVFFWGGRLVSTARSSHGRNESQRLYHHPIRSTHPSVRTTISNNLWASRSAPHCSAPPARPLPVDVVYVYACVRRCGLELKVDKCWCGLGFVSDGCGFVCRELVINGQYSQVTPHSKIDTIDRT